MHKPDIIITIPIKMKGMHIHIGIVNIKINEGRANQHIIHRHIPLIMLYMYLSYNAKLFQQEAHSNLYFSVAMMMC